MRETKKFYFSVEGETESGILNGYKIVLMF